MTNKSFLNNRKSPFINDHFNAYPKIRINFVMKLAKDFDVNGVIWYQLMYNEVYDIESYYFPQILKREMDIPMFKVESDYDAMEIAYFRTRVETFIETIKRGG